MTTERGERPFRAFARTAAAALGLWILGLLLPPLLGVGGQLTIVAGSGREATEILQRAGLPLLSTSGRSAATLQAEGRTAIGLYRAGAWLVLPGLPGGCRGGRQVQPPALRQFS
jgi:hypothetical protein